MTLKINATYAMQLITGRRIFHLNVVVLQAISKLVRCVRLALFIAILVLIPTHVKVAKSNNIGLQFQTQKENAYVIEAIFNKMMPAKTVF